jgi:hypothetical protein
VTRVASLACLHPQVLAENSGYDPQEVIIKLQVGRV